MRAINIVVYCFLSAIIIALIIEKYGGITLDGSIYLTVVLFFIGVLATFVVVSNYIQVKETKDEFEGFKKEIQDTKQYIYEYNNFQIKGDLCFIELKSFNIQGNRGDTIKAMKLGLRALTYYLKCEYIDSSVSIADVLERLKQKYKFNEKYECGYNITKEDIMHICVSLNQIIEGSWKFLDSNGRNCLIEMKNYYTSKLMTLF